MALKKYLITDDQVTISKGVLLGLGTKLADDMIAGGYIKKVSPHHYETIVDTPFNAKQVLWIEEKSAPKSGVKPVFMPRAYMEESAADVQKRDKFLASKQEPEVKNKGQQRK